MNIENLHTLKREELEELIETFEETIETYLNKDTKTDNDEYNIIKLELTIKIIDGVMNGKESVDTWYMNEWKYKDKVIEVLDEMGVEYEIKKLPKGTDGVICRVNLEVEYAEYTEHDYIGYD